jgi:hypothetical protein
MTHEQLKQQRDDLLAALEALVSWDAVMNDGDAPAWHQARRAIAQATGENYVTPEQLTHAICVHCDVSHHMDDAHTCADPDDPDLLAEGGA